MATKGWWRAPLPGSGNCSCNNTTSTCTWKDGTISPAPVCSSTSCNNGNCNGSSCSTGCPGGNPQRWYALKGQVLNVRPPKYAIVRKVVKQIMNEVSIVRRGIMTFKENSTYFDPAVFVGGGGATDLKPPYGSSSNCEVRATDRSEVRNAINSMSFDNNENSFAESLFSVGGYYSSQNSHSTWTNLWGGTRSGSDWPAGWPGASGWSDGSTMWLSGDQQWERGGVNRAFCSACQVSTVILITDGMADGDNTVPAFKMNRLVGLANPSKGINYCDEFGATKLECDQGRTPQGPTSENKNFADDVAYFLANYDLREDLGEPNPQRVFTYTIGFNTDRIATAFLRSMAKAGQGKYYSAADSTGLANAIFSALDDIKKRAVSFSSASVAQVQSEGSGSAIVPRLRPNLDDLWKGELWRFDLYNEFVERDLSNPSHADNMPDFDGDMKDIPVGCTGSACSRNPNYWSEVFTVDADKSIVTENNDGRFIKRGTTTPARAHWEAGDVLFNRAGAWGPPGATPGVGGRKIWTVVDSNSDGRITSADTMIDFSVANVATLRPYLNLDLEFCRTTLPNRLGMTLEQINTTLGIDLRPLASLALPLTNEAELDNCARLLIQYVRGRDIFDSDSDTDRSDNRPHILADMFHSSPVVVDPPVEKFLCEIGLHNQCVRTLYAQDLNTVATPLKDDYTAGSQKRDAYDEFRLGSGYCGSSSCATRPKLVLVGSNGGMIHAFDNGTWQSGSGTYSVGTGREMWAFIPPDLLPKLHLLTERTTHHYFVDGDMMVREIWADGTGGGTLNGMKEANEYRTMLIGSEGRGGTHYFALDITNPLDPKFRWFFPEPCTREAVEFGYTLYALSPKPPPMGPVLLQRSSCPSGFSNCARYGVPTEERWTVWLSGGYDPQLIRGRGIYAVDAWTGSMVWNFRMNDADPVRKNLGFSVTAPVALVDYGSNEDPIPDGFFDTAVFGDTAGQVWVTRMYRPGQLSGGVVTNWNGARSFQVDRDGITTAESDDDTDTNALAWGRKNPFYYIPAIGIQPDNRALRVMIGSGDRSNLRDTGHGQCRVDNPSACSKFNCKDYKSILTTKTTTFKLDKGESHWGSTNNTSTGIPVYKHSKWDTGSNSENACNAFTSEIKNELNNCQSSVNPGTIKHVKVTCRNGTCSDDMTPVYLDPDFGDGRSWAVPAAVGNNRFYGFWAYGADPTRTFNETLATTSTATGSPRLYDNNRLTGEAASPGNRDLKNVTNTTYNHATGTTSGTVAGDRDWGWFMDYFQTGETLADERSERTAGGAALIASCVLWNTLNPVGAVTSQCSRDGDNRAFFYQADFITGAPSCAMSFQSGNMLARKQERTVLTPPPEPATVIQISKTGAIRYSSMLLEPGKDQATQVNMDASKDILQMMYEAETSREAHICRHVDASKCK
ncbi:MAG: hypothetical protein ACK4N5_01725 [Myxococcales bacterium]